MSTYEQTTLAYACTADGRLQAVEVEEAIRNWSGGEGSFVICLDAWAAEGVRAFMKRLGIGDETIESIVETTHAPRVRLIEGSLLCEFPVRMDPGLGLMVTTSAVCLDRLLLLVRERPGEPWDADRDGRFHAVRATSAGVLATMLSEQSAGLRDDAADVRRRVVALARRMDAEPDALDVSEIVAARNEIIDLDAVVEERLPVLESLVAERTLIQHDEVVRDEIQTALTDARATARRLERTDRRLSEVQSRFDAHVQEKINRRLSRLTIISAVFLPLTLVAGIYGMNFERMPELRHPYAYPITLGGMAALAGSLVLWFKRRGWMD